MGWCVGGGAEDYLDGENRSWQHKAGDIKKISKMTQFSGLMTGNVIIVRYWTTKTTLSAARCMQILEKEKISTKTKIWSIISEKLLISEAKTTNENFLVLLRLLRHGNGHSSVPT